MADHQRDERKYFRYYDDRTKTWSVLPRVRDPKIRVHRSIEWYCASCSRWVDDDTQHVVCSNERCEDIWHFACAGLSSLPSGDWFCPSGCHGSPRGSDDGLNIDPSAEPSLVFHNLEEADGKRSFEALPPLNFSGKAYPRVLCKVDERKLVYFSLELAAEALGKGCAATAAGLAEEVGCPDCVTVTPGTNPKDYARLRELGFVAATAPDPRGGRARTLVSFVGIRELALAGLAARREGVEELGKVLEAEGDVQPVAVALPAPDVVGMQEPPASVREDEQENDRPAEPSPALKLIQQLQAVKQDLKVISSNVSAMQSDVEVLRGLTTKSSCGVAPPPPAVNPQLQSLPTPAAPQKLA